MPCFPYPERLGHVVFNDSETTVLPSIYPGVRLAFRIGLVKVELPNPE